MVVPKKGMVLRVLWLNLLKSTFPRAGKGELRHHDGRIEPTVRNTVSPPLFPSAALLVDVGVGKGVRNAEIG
jgi:hypothetical protein